MLAKISALTEPGSESQKAYDDAFGVLVGQHKPACFSNTTGNVLTQMENGYAKLLVVLSECGCTNPETLTVYNFYTWLDYLDEKYEAQKPKPQPNATKR